MQVKEVFDDDVRNSTMEMEDARDAIRKSQLLKDGGNRFFRTKRYQMDIIRYDKYLQYLCAVVPVSNDDARLMDELGISLNINLAACWLMLCAYAVAREHCELMGRTEVATDSAAALASPVEVGCLSQLILYDGELDEFGRFSEPDLRIDERKKKCALVE
ncbi:hypothetical protein Cgig2_003814 [Carnegiea gigantea]|uniref:Uncharacterized protein n=1 Tax=Carnegiea gigantea TaxID=171969 RepID=A0A9Q1K689_9CARY|nr:hypothetical protein Cgig2_003814 [Carnegiea gigantea]